MASNNDDTMQPGIEQDRQELLELVAAASDDDSPLYKLLLAEAVKEILFDGNLGGLH